jgi:hypothetical protein
VEVLPKRTTQYVSTICCINTSADRLFGAVKSNGVVLRSVNDILSRVAHAVDLLHQNEYVLQVFLYASQLKLINLFG